MKTSLYTSLLCIFTLSSCKSDKTEPSAASIKEENDAQQSQVVYPMKQLSWKQTAEEFGDELCGYRELSSEDGLRKMEVVFRSTTEEFSGYRYAITINDNGEVVSCEAMGPISTTGGFYCHAFYGASEKIDLPKFKDLYGIK